MQRDRVTHALILDKGAVGAAQVIDALVLAFELDRGVLARNRLMIHDQVIARRAVTGKARHANYYNS